MKTYREVKLKLWKKLQNKGYCSAGGSLTAGSRNCGCEYCGNKASMRLMEKHNTLAQDRGRRRLFEHMRNQGEQVETLWESGKTIRHLTQEEGQVI